MNMNAQHLHHKSVAREFLAVTPRDFVPIQLTVKALNDDSCWDEYETEYAEESLSIYVL
jgi:hypothetical protein